MAQTAQTQKQTIETTPSDRPQWRAPRAPGLLLECPICKHDNRVRAAELLDGQELRCTACRSELVVVREEDPRTGRDEWTLESLEDDYDDDQP